ncbi:MAG TPA: hypothetical protein VLT87_00365 [Thermoanaerobaculia bacterium]|nr:hypothetical protein [Thermoanaerobaculia bacterium]
MLKKPLAVVAILSLCLLATPVTAMASTRTETPSIGAPTLILDLFEAWTAWWGSLLGGAADEAPAGASLLEKGNGCGIDPNGQPLCGGWTGATVTGDPVEEPGSGN